MVRSREVIVSSATIKKRWKKEGGIKERKEVMIDGVLFTSRKTN